MAAIRALRNLRENGVTLERVVDYGSGLGVLAPEVRNLGLSYLGLEIDDAALAICKAQFASTDKIVFERIRSEPFPEPLTPTDLVVMNGVVHHLNESNLQRVLESTDRAAAIIILDHVKVARITGLFSLINYLLQICDKGKHVRPYEYFDTLRQSVPIRREQFTIRILGVPLWQYFCHTYRWSAR